MGLIKCPDCKKLFSDRIDSCPFCGCPRDAAIIESEKNEEKNMIIINDINKGSISIIIICLFVLFICYIIYYSINILTCDRFLIYALYDFIFYPLIFLPIPLLCGVLKSNLSNKILHEMCLLNSSLIFIVLFMFAITTNSQLILGWIPAVFYYFINKNIILNIQYSMKHKLVTIKKIMILYVLVILILLLILTICSYFIKK
jgi:hypothetical protein